MTVPNNLALAALLLGGGGGAHAFPANESTYINVHIPQSLHKNATNGTYGYSHLRTQIGAAWSDGRLPPQGSMALNVYYLEDDDMCTFPLNKTTGHPTTQPRDPNGEWMPPFALLADKGSCTFTTKARNAQMAGAAAVFFADTQCLCKDEHCAASQPIDDKTICHDSDPSVADDGSGSDVSIPSFLLRKSGAVDIKATLKNNTPVLLDVRWHPPQVEEFVNYTIWMDVLDNSTKDLLRDFKPVASALGSKASFSPQYVIYNGTLSGCVGNTGENDTCHGVCTNNGRYCYPSHRISGSAIVVETLRRACVWKHRKPEGPEGDRTWWDYVTYFNEHCSDQNETFADETCVNGAYSAGKVNKEEVEACMKDTGGTDGDEINEVLEKSIEERTSHGVYFAPTVHIGDRTLSWTAASDTPARAMLETICGDFEALGVPEVCARCLKAEDVVSCAAADDSNHGGGGDDNGGGGGAAAPKQRHPFRNFMIFLLVAGSLGGIGFYVYKMRDSHTDSSWNLRYAMLGDNDGAEQT